MQVVIYSMSPETKTLRNRVDNIFECIFTKHQNAVQMIESWRKYL